MIRRTNSVFVSFCGRRGRDKSFVRHLLSRLRMLGVDVWVYETPEGEIPIAEDILGACLRKIDAASDFIAVVTETAFDSEFTKAEVAHALEARKKRDLRVMCVASADLSFKHWPEPFDALLELRSLSADFSELGEAEPILVKLSLLLGFEYEPATDAHPNLPVLGRLIEEISAKVPRSNQHEVGVYLRALEKARSVGNYYARGERRQALRRVNGLIDDLVDEFDLDFYYPYIVRAVLLTELGRHEDALSDLSSLASSDRSDEARLSLMGHIALRQGDDHTAHRHYVDAWESWRARRDTGLPLVDGDPDLAYNVIHSAFLVGEDLTGGRVEQLLGVRSLEEFDARGRNGAGPEWRLLAAVERSRQGDRKGALALACHLGRASDVDLIVSAVDILLQGAGNSDEGASKVSLGILEHYAKSLKRESPEKLFPIWHRLARLYRDFEKRRKCEAMYRRLVAPSAFPRSIQFLCEYAVFKLERGKDSQARELCERAIAVTSPAGVQPPMELSEFHFYMGFCYWLLGKEEAATAFHALSGHETRYATLAPMPLSRL